MPATATVTDLEAYRAAARRFYGEFAFTNEMGGLVPPREAALHMGRAALSEIARRTL